MGDAARRAGVRILGGDTKVVEHGKADLMYVTTTGFGELLPGVSLAASSVRPGDRVLVSGPIGDHGITILLARGDLDLEADLSSDTRSVVPLVAALVDAAGSGVRWMRDPTRGGVATALNELARDCGLGIAPRGGPAAGPRRCARRLRAARPGSAAHRQRRTVSRHRRARARRRRRWPRSPPHPVAIWPPTSARFVSRQSGTVIVETNYGGSRVVDMLVGDALPRIC